MLSAASLQPQGPHHYVQHGGVHHEAPLFDQLAEPIYEDDEKKKVEFAFMVRRFQELLPVFLLPWVMFTMIIVAFTFFGHTSLGYLTLAYFIAVACIWLYNSRGPKSKSWLILSLICLIITLLGFGLARYIYSAFLEDHMFIDSSRWYSNVRPDENPGAKKDASLVSFSKDSFVDESRSAGYSAGSIYCVAPIVMDSSQHTVGYWAVGEDCCHGRGRFHCGDLSAVTDHSVVVFSIGGLGKSQSPYYMKAAQMAAAANQMDMLENPTFVRWSTTSAAYKGRTLGYAIVNVMTAVIVGLILCLLCGMLIVVLKLKGLQFPYPREAQKMYFGPDLSRCGGRKPSNQLEVEQKLLEDQVCWSGEVIYDYIFHVCNKSMVLGIVGCHPYHPYDRLERIGVAIIVFALIVFPVSVFALFIEKGGLTWFLLVAVLVTGPRNLVKVILHKMALEPTELRLEHGARRHGVRATNARKWELIAFIAMFVVVALVCVVTVNLLLAKGKDVWQVLRVNCDGIGYALILELIFELVIPHHADGINGQKLWNIGFFGRWRYEKDIAVRAALSVRPKLQEGHHEFTNLGEEAHHRAHGSVHLPGFRRKTNAGLSNSPRAAGNVPPSSLEQAPVLTAASLQPGYGAALA